ncbi:glutamyl aminopeptidase-like [Ylistrum balloti]|uniref:glutamyl aminopeptidase-like n=1 Tax=Ylistrum balloti TaxID=509963 RepID=UPI002905AE35|nr:glutamyl aminopeptidase-like [Ylistrum balloti]
MGMQKFRAMDDGEDEGTSKVSVNKRLLYFLLGLLIVVPITVGVLVWYLAPPRSCDNLPNVEGDSAANTEPEVTSAITTTKVPNFESEPWKNLRLPRYIIPVHYEITLYPDIYDGNGWFYGNESIEIRITKDTSYILIHFNYMNITKTNLKDNSTGATIPIKRTFSYEENQFWVIETVSPVLSGAVVRLETQYDGSLTRSIVGLYKSRYVNSITGETRYLATSKFEPVDARRAFPSFDEPNVKAQYTVHLVHQPGYTALSNMPEVVTVPWSEDSSLMITSFQRSVDMSTYLVCFIVCDFRYLESRTKSDIPVRTFATPDRVNQTKFSLDLAVHSMDLYEELFNVSYPLPKQDLIAIPDFVSGAMEHWGLITFRETNMLFDPEEASSANQQRVAVVVAHEIAHQWFGNIVTMDWWDDLWLNEGFASFMEYLGAASFKPSWDMMEQFVTEDAQPVMLTDSGMSSHPIIVEVTSPNQINEVFDSISYSKGASVIRMLESVMGKDKFFEGVGKYLKKFVWGNAKTDDLWAALGMADEAAGLSVKAVMDTWTRQMGLPYVDVTFSFTENKVTAVQKRFLADSSMQYNATESPYMYKWYIHLDHVSNTGSGSPVWISKNEDSVEFEIHANPQMNQSVWFKFNVNQTGFYRVNYPTNLWMRFATMLQNGDIQELSNVDKAGLINDALNFARAGQVSYDVALSMTLYLDKEFNHLPWESAYTAFAYISSMFQYGGSFGPWREYVVMKSKPALEQLGWADTGTHLQKLMRMNLIALTCGHSDSDCLDNATVLFRAWLDNGQVIPPNLRQLVYRYGMENAGTDEDWNAMWDKYTTETVPQEKTKLLYGLSRTKKVWLLSRYLGMTKNESLVRTQDFFTVLVYISGNPVGRSLVWNWVRENWHYLVDRFTLYSRSLGRLIPRVIRTFNTEFQLEEVLDFIKKHPDAGAGARTRDQALETIRRNIAWMERYKPVITEWLCHQVKC